MNEKLRQLIAEACLYPLRSRERRIRFNEIIRIVTRSHIMLCCRNENNKSYYDDAVQEMWEHCYKHPEDYDPRVNRVTTWLIDELKRCLRRYRDRQNRQVSRQIPIDNGLNILPDPDISDIYHAFYLERNFLSWVLRDPDEVLRGRCFRNRSEINARALIRRRFSINIPWKIIAAEFNLNEFEAEDLPKFFSRHCRPLLRQFDVEREYVEEGYVNIPSQQSQQDRVSSGEQFDLLRILIEYQGAWRSLYFQNRPEIHAGLLILLRLPESISWTTIGETFNLSSVETTHLSEFYDCRCLPLLYS